MSSYYDDEEVGPVMRERDEDALNAEIEDREAEAERKRIYQTKNEISDRWEPR